MDNRRLSFVENIFIGSSIFWTRFGPTNENNAVRVCWHDNMCNTIIENGRCYLKSKTSNIPKTKSTMKNNFIQGRFEAVFLRIFAPRSRPCFIMRYQSSPVKIVVSCPLYLFYLGHFLSSFATHFWLFYSGLYSSRSRQQSLEGLPGPRPGLEGGNVSLRDHVLIAADVVKYVCRHPFSCLEWAGPFYWIFSIRGVVAVPLVCIGGGWGELNGGKSPFYCTWNLSQTCEILP